MSADLLPGGFGECGKGVCYCAAYAGTGERVYDCDVEVVGATGGAIGLDIWSRLLLLLHMESRFYDGLTFRVEERRCNEAGLYIVSSGARGAAAAKKVAAVERVVPVWVKGDFVVHPREGCVGVVDRNTTVETEQNAEVTVHDERAETRYGMTFERVGKSQALDCARTLTLVDYFGPGWGIKV